MERKWLIMASICLLSFFQYGSLKALEISVPRLINELDMTAMEAGLTCSIAAALATLLGPLWGAIAQWSSDRIVTVAGSILMAVGLISVSFAKNPIFVHISMAILGIGRGLPMVAKVTIIKDHFPKHFNMANSWASAGGSLGFFILPPLVEILIYEYGWRGGLMIFGAMCFNSGFSGALMKGKQEGERKPVLSYADDTKTVNKDGKTKYRQITSNSEIEMKEQRSATTSSINLEENEELSNTDNNNNNYFSEKTRQIFGCAALAKNPAFVLDLIAFTLLDMALCGWILFLFTFLTSSGLEYFTASTVSALGGAGSLVGRMVFGPILDGKLRGCGLLSPRLLLAISALIGGVTLFLYPYTTTYIGWGILAFSTGIFAGTTTPIYTAIIENKFTDDSDFGAALGLHYMVRGIGMICGGPLTGFIFDKTGNFDLAFDLMAACQLIGGALICLELCLKKLHCIGEDKNNLSKDEEGEEESL